MLWLLFVKVTIYGPRISDNTKIRHILLRKFIKCKLSFIHSSVYKLKTNKIFNRY